MATLILALPAQAADLTKAPLAPAAYSWTGAYVGANFGGVFNRERVTTLLGIGSTDPSGVPRRRSARLQLSILVLAARD
jgi:hypothetical protein